MSRRGLLVAVAALCAHCSAKKEPAKKDESDDDDDSPKKPKKGSTSSSAAAASSAGAGSAGAGNSGAGNAKLRFEAFSYGLNLASAYNFALSKNQEKYDKYLARLQAGARELGLAVPASVTPASFGADASRITKEVFDKHGVPGRALFVCGMQGQNGLAKALDNEDIVAKKLNEPLFDVAPQVQDLEISLPRTGLPSSSWEKALASLKAKPSSENFKATLMAIAGALDRASASP